jgi:hypothetical protein
LTLGEWPLSSEQFRAVQPERLHTDQYFALLRHGNGNSLNFENLRATRFVDDCGFHRAHQWTPMLHARGGLVVEKQYRAIFQASSIF